MRGSTGGPYKRTGGGKRCDLRKKRRRHCWGVYASGVGEAGGGAAALRGLFELTYASKHDYLAKLLTN